MRVIIIDIKWGEYGIKESSIRYFYQVSNDLKNLLYYPSWIGHYDVTVPYRVQRESYGDYMLTYINKGCYFLEYNQKKYYLKEGDSYFIDCSNPHHYGVYQGEANIYFIHLNGPNLPNLYNYLTEYNGIIRSSVDTIQVGTKLKSIFDLLNHQSSIINGQQLSLLIYDLILSYNKDYQETVIIEEGIVSQAIKYIHEHMKKAITLDDLSNHVGLSRYHFSHRFKEETGVSPIKYIKNIKLSRAKELLKSSDLSIKEIGQSIGYDNQNSFSQVFRNEFNIAPSTYRKLY